MMLAMLMMRGPEGTGVLASREVSKDFEQIMAHAISRNGTKMFLSQNVR